MRQIGIIGGSQCTGDICNCAFEIGALLAKEDVIVINGGLGGVMESVSSGVASKGGTVIGVIPSKKRTEANESCTAVIATDMGHARNVIIVHSSDALIAVGGSHGTLSEMAIALKEQKPVVAIAPPVLLDGVVIAHDAHDAVEKVLSML